MAQFILFSSSIEGIYKEQLERIARLVYPMSQDRVDRIDNQELERLAIEFSISLPMLQLDNIKKDIEQFKVSGEVLAQMGLHTFPGKIYDRDRGVYSIPYTGDIGLLKYSGDGRFSLNPLVTEVANDSLVFKYPMITEEQANKVSELFEQDKWKFTQELAALQDSINSFNNGLKESIQMQISLKKEDFRRLDHLRSKL